MAVGMLLAGPAVTRDTYEKVTEKMFGTYPMPPEKAPDGLIIHTAGETPEGWYIYDVWESKEKFLSFNENMVGPAMQEIVGDAPQEGPPLEPQFYDIEVMAGPA